MPEDNRVVELLAEMLHQQSEMVQQLKRLGSIDNRLERVEEQQKITNLKLQEHTLSIQRLADKMDIVLPVLDRIAKLEAAVFH